MGLLGTKRCPTADKSKEERGVDEIERLQRYHEDRHGRRITEEELREHLERETGEENRARPGSGRPRTVGLEGTVVPAYLLPDRGAAQRDRRRPRREEPLPVGPGSHRGEARPRGRRGAWALEADRPRGLAGGSAGRPAPGARTRRRVRWSRPGRAERRAVGPRSAAIRREKEGAGRDLARPLSGVWLRAPPPPAPGA